MASKEEENSFFYSFTTVNIFCVSPASCRYHNIVTTRTYNLDLQGQVEFQRAASVRVDFLIHGSLIPNALNTIEDYILLLHLSIAPFPALFLSLANHTNVTDFMRNDITKKRMNIQFKDYIYLAEINIMRISEGGWILWSLREFFI